MMWQQLTEQAEHPSRSNITGASVVHGQIAQVGVDALDLVELIFGNAETVQQVRVAYRLAQC